MHHQKHVFVVLVVICAACSIASASPSDAKQSVRPPRLAVDLPDGWTKSRHPGLHQEGEFAVFVNESNIAQVSVWLLSPEGRTPGGVAQKAFRDHARVVDPSVEVRGPVSWEQNGLRWAAMWGRTRETIAAESVYAVRDLGGTPYIVVCIGIWPAPKPQMRKDVAEIISGIHAEGTALPSKPFDWFSDSASTE